MRPESTAFRVGAALTAALAVLLSLYTPAALVVGSAEASFAGLARALVNSTLLALACGLLGALLGTLSAIVIWESVPRRYKRYIRRALFAAAGTPSLVIALAVALLLPAKGGMTAVYIALTLSIAPYAARYMLGELETMPAYTVEAMHALGAGGMRTIIDGVLPNTRDSLISTSLYCCARALTEVAALSLLLDPRFNILALRLVVEPLSPSSFPTALALSALAMLLFDRARASKARR